MAYDIGPKIGIEGEAEYRQQINNIIQQMRTLDTEMQAVRSAFQDNERSVESYTAQNEVLNRQIDTQRQRLQLLQQMLQAAADNFGEADTRTMRWQQAVNRATTELNNLETTLRRNNAAIDELTTGVNQSADAMETAEGAASSFGDVLQANLSAEAIKAGAEAITGAVSGIATSLADYSTEAENAAVKATAYFGETGAAAEETADVIKDVYTSGVGDSMDQVADAVINLKSNIDDLSQADLTNLTQQAVQMEQLYGTDVSETFRGVNALMQQFGIDAQTAMDYIVTGTQNGLDKTQELGDNLSEYAGKFAEAGYSADEYFQLLNNGLDNGAYNLDKVNDAINEVTTRLGDGTIADSIGQYSTKTQELFTAWQNGGATQKDVIDSIVNDISNATTQQEAFNLASTAFGTIAEDGGIKMVSALTSVGDTYTDVTGKASEFYDQTQTKQQEFDSSLRTFQDALSPIADTVLGIIANILSAVTPLVEQFGTWFAGLSPAVQTVISVIAAIAAAIGPLIVVIGTVVSAITSIGTAIAPVLTALGGLSGVVGALATVFNPVTLAIGAVVAALTLLYTQSETFRDIVNAAFEAVKTVVTTVLDSILALLSGDTEEFMRIAVETGENLKNTVSEVLDAVFGFFSDIFSKIGDTVSKTIGNIETTIGSGLDTIKELWDSAWTFVGDTINNAITTVGNAVNNIKDTITDTFQDIINSAFDWGSNLIDGFIDGIKSMIGSVGDVASQVAGAVSDFIGFNSPSKKGEGRYIIDWGRNMIDGFLQGAEEAMPDVSAMAGNITSTMGAGLLSDNSGTTAGGGTINITVNVGSVRNNNDIKAISRELNRSIKGYERALGVT